MQINKEELLKTLEAAGVKHTPNDIEILASARPEEIEESKIYEQTNQMLLSDLKEGPLGRSIHITGEMRALTDPSHRRVCRQSWEKNRERVKMICYLPPDRRGDGGAIWKWNMSNWKNVNWTDHLDAFNLIADGEVELYTSPERERIHFSVFGDEYVLLQSYHEHNIEVKYVWLLVSAALNSYLGEKAQAVLNVSERVPLGYFKRLMDNLSDDFAFHTLYSLEEKPSSVEKFIDAPIGNKSFREEVLSDLNSVGFVHEDKGYLSITNDGMEYLKLLN